MKTRVIQDEPDPNDGHFAGDTDTNAGERPSDAIDAKVVADEAAAESDGGSR